MAPISLEGIEKAWRARQDRVRVARLSWTEKVTEPRGSISAAMPRVVRRRLQLTGKEVIPSEDKTVDFRVWLDLDGGKARFAYEGLEWAGGNTQRYRPVKYVSVFDGEGGKNLYPEGLGSGTWPQGVIRKGSRFRDAQFYRLRPALLAYRALMPALRPFDLRGMVVASGRQVINGRPCVRLERHFPGTNGSMQLWLDAEREYVVVRHLILEQGQVRVKMDVRYKESVGAGWVPESWMIASHATNDRLIDSTQAVMANAEFNEPTRKDSFSLTFPPGALVIDEATGENWIAKPNGKRRPILPEDQGATYEQLVKSDPGEAMGRRRKAFLFTWPGLLLACAGCSALGVFIWRRVRSRLVFTRGTP